MYIRSSEYLSRFTGQQIDDAIENIRDYDAELALKADKSTTVNGQPLSEDVNITAEDIGALSVDTPYGASLGFDDGNLSLVDKDGAVLGEPVYVYPDLSGKQDLITSENMLSSDLVSDSGKVHKFATEAQLTQISTNTSEITTINSKIPSQATSSNPLADRNFVNSSISTNTAYFIGTFGSVAELEAYSGSLTNNDYAFVETHDTAGNTFYDRYKYNSNTQAWAFEYEINNSSFTANQWDTINSGLSANDKTQIAINTSAIATMTSTMSGFGDIVTHDASEFATSAQGILADSALQPSSVTSTYSATGTAPINGTAVAEAISTKQDTIDDLETIRAGATAGLTALQPSDVSSTYDSSGTAPVNGTAVASALASIPSVIVDQAYDASSTNPQSGTAVAGAISTKQDSSTAVTHTQTTSVGDTTTPVYVDSTGVATAISYSIGTSVPSNAVFTDTTYTTFIGADGTTAGSSGLVPQPQPTDNTNFLRGDGVWASQISSITELSDVSISSPLQKQVISYNSISGKWENSDPTTVTFVDWTT